MAVAVPTSQIIFSSRLIQQLLRRNEVNVFVSPAGIALALGMAAAAARGQTLTAVEQTLGVDVTLAANSAKRLFASFDRLPPGLAVELANSIWARSGLPLSPRYVAEMRETYRGEVRNIDFALPEATTLVNDWVARATHGRIANAVDRIDPSSVMALVNATYFRGAWEDPFDPDDTVEHEFRLGSGGVTKVQLMSESGSFDYAQDPDLQAVRLPYTDGRFSLLVILPREVLLPPAFHDIASPSSLARIVAALENRRGRVGLPKVGVSYTADLTSELLEMGMGPAFSADADFSGVFDEDIPAFISKVLHKTRLDIDEKGTIAAAATFTGMSVGMSLDMVAHKPFEMIVDRPFLILLTERETDLVLFIGAIGDPGGHKASPR